MYKRVKHFYVEKGVRKEYADIYVGTASEGLEIDTNDYIQGSKLYVVDSAMLYVLKDTGGLWCDTIDGSPLS